MVVLVKSFGYIYPDRCLIAVFNASVWQCDHLGVELGCVQNCSDSECFALDPCACWRSTFRAGIQGKTLAITLHYWTQRNTLVALLFSFFLSFFFFFFFVCSLCTVCHGLFACPLGVIGRLWSVIVAIPGHLLYYFTRLKTQEFRFTYVCSSTSIYIISRYIPNSNCCFVCPTTYGKIGNHFNGH